jgi:peptide/nickel transport system permease protein
MTMTIPSLAIAEASPWRQSFGLLWRDKFAFAAVMFLILVALAACFGPWLLGTAATKINLLARNAPPLSTHLGWHYVLGAAASSCGSPTY